MTPTKILASMLTDFFRRKQEARRGYSLRAFARDLDLSASHISRVLRGEKFLSSLQLSKVFKVLDIDFETRTKILELYARGKLGHLQSHYLQKRSDSTSLLNFRKLSKNKMSLLSRWYYVPVLELITIAPEITTKSIASRLGITTGMAEESLKVLLNLKIIQRGEDGAGKWQRQVERMRLASSSSLPEIRAYHSEMIQKAAASLRRTDEVSFSQRLITGITIGGNLEKLEQAKAILNDALHRASELMNEGPCTEVYQLNLQIFPLTKKTDI